MGRQLRGRGLKGKEVEVVSKRETSKPEQGLIVFRDHVLNQRDETVFQIDKTVLIKRRGDE